MSYRPITDLWILARPKVKYYGAYPNGFLERAKALLGVTNRDPILHVCGGHAKSYPNKRIVGLNDYTLDLDPACNPDFLRDARDPLPDYHPPVNERNEMVPGESYPEFWPAILIDPPYTEADADKYQPTSSVFPSANLLLKNGLAAVRPGGRVGMLHYLLPQPPREGVRFIACIGVIVGYNNRMRCFSVFEKEDK